MFLKTTFHVGSKEDQLPSRQKTLIGPYGHICSNAQSIKVKALGWFQTLANGVDYSHCPIPLAASSASVKLKVGVEKCPQEQCAMLHGRVCVEGETDKSAPSFLQKRGELRVAICPLGAQDLPPPPSLATPKANERKILKYLHQLCFDITSRKTQKRMLCLSSNHQKLLRFYSRVSADS